MRHRWVVSRGATQAILVLGVMVSLLVMSQTPVPAAPTIEEVTLNTGWLPVAETAGWFLAAARGYFAQEQLSVKIVRGFGSGDTVLRVAAKQVEFGVADLGTMIVEKANRNLPVRMVAVLFARNPHGVWFFPESGIEKPKDLEGKTIACTVASTNRILFPAFAKVAGVDHNKVKWALVDPALVSSTFLSGRADAFCEFHGTVPFVEAQAKRVMSGFSYAGYGLQLYSSGIVVHEDTIRTRRDLVARFVRAALRGLQAAVDNPAEGVDAIVKAHPEVNREPTLQGWLIDIKLYVVSPEGLRFGLGYMDPGRVETSLKHMNDAFELKAKLQLGDIFTNDFIPPKQ